MPLSIMRLKKHPGTDRRQLALAALEWCRAVKSVEGARARFYWNGPNELGFLIEAASGDALNTVAGYDTSMPPELAKATFAMADLGDPVPSERWNDPDEGEQLYRAAGRE